jgi:arylsulfatase A-like enzyme
MATKQPNIVAIMSDDVGIWNIGAYHRGMMAGRTPNLDKLASEGMLFTDYYAEASCTAGRAAFITGQLPIRTGRRSARLAPHSGFPPRPAHLQPRSSRWDMPQASSARTILAIKISSCPPFMGSTSSSVTSITSTRWRTLRTRATPKSC